MMSSNEERKLHGKLFLILGPSGSGKSTVLNALKAKYPGFVYPVSSTTRDMREGDVDGQTYNFISEEKFKKMVDAGEFLEYAIVHEKYYYGTPKSDILDVLEAGAIAVLDVDVQGFHSIQKMIPEENLVSIFLTVGNEDDLRARILHRGELEEEEIARRMISMKEEIKVAVEADHRVENLWGGLDLCLKNVEKIILDEIDDLY